MYNEELTSKISRKNIKQYDKITVDKRTFDKLKNIKTIRIDSYYYDEDKDIGFEKSRIKEWNNDKLYFDSGEEKYRKIDVDDMICKINEIIKRLSDYPIDDNNSFINVTVIGYGVPDDTMRGIKIKRPEKYYKVEHLKNSVRNMF